MRNYLIKLFLFFTPFLLVFQPFFFEEIQFLLILMRYIIIPIIIIYFIKDSSIFLWVLFAIFYFFLNLLLNTDFANPDSHTSFLNVISSLCYFILGTTFIIKNRYDFLKHLRYGIDLFNSFTIFVYFSALFSFSSIVYYFRDDDLDFISGYSNIYDRFSFGNSIEVPFLITCLLLTVILSKPNKPIFFSLILNLIAGLISGSRLVILLSLSLLLFQLFKSNSKYSSFFIFILIMFSFSSTIIIDGFFNSFELLYDRFALVKDSRSFFERYQIFNSFYNSLMFFDLKQLLFGNGFNSSYEFVQNSIGGYRTLESIFLQIFYETGLIGFYIFIVKFFKRFLRKFSYFEFLIVFIILLQLFIFLPIFTYMQIIFLVLGLLSSNSFSFSKV